MLLVGTVLLAWAVALRVASNALFAALACWMSLWVFIWSRVLQLLGTPWTASLAGGLTWRLPHPEVSSQQPQQQRGTPVKEHTLARLPSQQPREHVHSWVQQSAALLHGSPAASSCPSITSTPHRQQQQHRLHHHLHNSTSTSRDTSSFTQQQHQQHQQQLQSFSQQSSSNGGSGGSNSSSAGTGRHVISGITKVAEQRMLQVFQGAEKIHEAAPAAAGVWATSVLLAKCISAGQGSSEPGAPMTPRKQGHRSSVGMCPPPLEYEASEELQQELEAAAPDGFLCPIGRVLMTDPVFTPSGFTFHRPCIMAYIQRFGRDPAQDTSPLSPSQLCPNVNLRDQIATWLQRQGVET